jgi:hypothetical protein
MKRLLRHTMCGLVPATAAALLLGIPTASPDVGLQNVNLSCNDSTNLGLALEPTELTALSDAVSAISLYPAGDPALACSLSPAAAGSGNPQHDYAVGAGYRVNPTTGVVSNHFALSAHDGPKGVFGTYNSMSDAPGKNFDGDVTCLFVQGNQAIVGGVVRKGGDVGQQGTGFAVGFRDNGSPGNSLMPDQTTLTDIDIDVSQTPVDCMAESVLFSLTLFPVTPGNVTIRDAP